MIEVHELRIFVAAAEEENFSAAARKLHLSQPAVSFQIQSLEQHLNVQLFHRDGRHITLTEAGHELLPLAREMINLATRIEETMCAGQGIVKGNVVIGCTTSPGKYVLPYLIGAFRQKYPETHFSVQVMTRLEAEEQLLAKQVHIGVLGLPAKSKDLECFPFFTDELILITPVHHPWAARGSITLKDLYQADWIVREGTAATRQAVSATLNAHGLRVDDLRVVMELGSVEAIEAAVEAGHGVSFVSRVAVRRGLELGKIKAIRVKGLHLQRQIYLARNKLRACTCAQLKFREFIESPEGQKLIAQLTRA